MAKSRNLFSIEDIIAENKDGDFLAICKSGKSYKSKFNARLKTMFFCMPEHEIILGYKKL